jgi:hypothetical protein
MGDRDAPARLAIRGRAGLVGMFESEDQRTPTLYARDVRQDGRIIGSRPVAAQGQDRVGEQSNEVG